MRSYTTPPGLAGANGALRTLGIDLEMAAAVGDADVLHSHTWYANMAGVLGASLHKKPHVLTSAGEKHYFAEYHTVFCSIDIDELWGENTLPYTGRMMIPLLIPGLGSAFPEGAESLHYSSCEFQTRVTEMKVITRHESPDTLILIEVPVLPGAAQAFPRNTIDYALENNLFAEKAYP